METGTGTATCWRRARVCVHQPEDRD